MLIRLIIAIVLLLPTSVWAARGFGATDGAGSTDVITTGYQASPTTVSYAIWAYRTGAGGGNLGRIFDKDSASTGKRDFFESITVGNTYIFQVGFSTTDGDWNIAAPSGSAWHLFVITYNGSNVANVPVIYVDGSAVTVNTGTAPVGTIDTSATNFLIGNRADGIRNWNGRLAEFAVWENVTLSAGQVTALWNGGAGARMDSIANTPTQYWKVCGVVSPEPNEMNGGTSGALTGTAAQTHPFTNCATRKAGFSMLGIGD